MRKGSIYSNERLDKIIKEFKWGSLNQDKLAKELGMPQPSLSAITLYYRRRINPERVGKQVVEYLDNVHPLPKIIEDGSDVSRIMSLYIDSDISQEEIAKKVGLNNSVTSLIIRYFYRRGILSKNLPARYKNYIDGLYPLTKGRVVPLIKGKAVKVKKDNTVPIREVSILWGLIKIKY